MAKEPEQLKRGKTYHKKVQKDWQQSADGIVVSEKQIKKPNNKMGRINIHIEADNKLVAVVELKNSDWDGMTTESVKRNLKHQAKQIWSYIESQLSNGKDVSPGIIFPKKPKNPDKLKLIELFFEEEFISVVWEDETIDDRNNRA